MNLDPRIILLVTQVIIESLPISSSGHLRIAELLLARAGIALGTLPKFFEHFLNGPALLVMGVYFYKPWSTLVRLAVRVGLYGGARKARTAAVLLKLIGLVLASELAMLGWMFVFGRGLKMYESLPLLAGGFVLTGLVLASSRLVRRQRYLSFPRRLKVVREWAPDELICHSREGGNPAGAQVAMAGRPGLQAKPNKICPGSPPSRGRHYLNQWAKVSCEMSFSGLTFPKAILLGLLQGFVYGIPGLSRFACTVVAARWLGLSPRRALEFSFMIFAPLVLGAFCINGLPAVLADAHAASFFTIPWLVAYAGSTLCAYLIFAGVARLALTDRLWYFAGYMSVPVAVTLWLWMW